MYIIRVYACIHIIIVYKRSFVTLTVAVLGAGGGILVAGNKHVHKHTCKFTYMRIKMYFYAQTATLKYADAILKTLATAGSIVISTVLGHFFLDGPLDIIMCIGACTVIVSIFNYTMDSTGEFLLYIFYMLCA